MATDNPTVFDHQQFLSTVSRKAGIYQMYDSDSRILYVGKAKNLKNRLSSYFRGTGHNLKTMALVNKIHHIEVTIAASESAALVLEQSLIKSLKPPYNILLRDDKSYPHIFISDKAYPRIASYRGAKTKKGQYFGPYPNKSAVFHTLNFIQKTFRIRQCEESVFKNRSRPCLQYQINRCSAPCVEYISQEDYARDINYVTLFLKGRSNELMQTLANNMEQAAEALDFEKAAMIRDQIALLRNIQAGHDAEQGSGILDIFSIEQQAHATCVHVIFIRDGRILGSKSYFPDNRLALDAAEYLLHFLEQFYCGQATRELPHEIITNVALPKEEQNLLREVLTEKAARKVQLLHNVRAQRYKWLSMAVTAAQQNLAQQLNTKASLQQRFNALQEAMGIDDSITRMECFDISHSSGELTVASCVVFNEQGALKSDYRRFNIEGITAGDDYAAMEQALSRRYTRVQKEEGQLPDLLIVDGGKGQMSTAKAVMAELGISQITLLGIAKGTTRKAGFETLILDNGTEKTLNADSAALHLLQEIRDEAHRFAITGHKQRRDKKRRQSTLEEIEGVGAKRRRELLRHFGGLQSIKQASIDELAKVNGISKKLAEHIYNSLHEQ